MKKIVVLVGGLFWITFGIVGFSQNLPLSFGNLTDTKSDFTQQNHNDFKVTDIQEGSQISSNKNLPNQQILTDDSDFQQLPIHVVMDEFVFHVGFVQNKIDEDSAKGLNVKALREFYKNRAKLTDEEDMIFKKEIKEAARILNVTDNKIKAITQAYRAKVARGVIPGQSLPDIPTELTVLKKEREAFLTELPDVLETKLGSSGYRRLKFFIDQEIAPRIRPIMAAGVRDTMAQTSSILQP